MFTENEVRRIQGFNKESERLERQLRNLQERLWYQTHGAHDPAKAAQLEHRRRLLANKSANLYQKQLQYANTLKRKYKLRVHSAIQPNLKNIEKALKLATRRRVAERVMRPSSLSQNLIRSIARTAYPSPRARLYSYMTRRYTPVEPW